jgi:hypothetical protein
MHKRDSVNIRLGWGTFVGLLKLLIRLPVPSSFGQLGVGNIVGNIVRFVLWSLKA